MKHELPSLVERIQNGEFIKSVQLDPPKRDDIDRLLDDVRKLKKVGATVFDINESRRDCLSSFEVASLLSDNAEVIPHITPREGLVNHLPDRAIIESLPDGARKRSLLTQLDAHPTTLIQTIAEGYGHGIRAALVITGDPYKPVDGQEDPRNVFQTNSVGVIASINKYLRAPNGLYLEAPMPLTIAAAVNQNANLDQEANRLRAKERQGTDFFMSQPVFDAEQADALYKFYSRHSEKPLLAGIWPMTSIKTIDNVRVGKIKGVSLPETAYVVADDLREKPDDLRAWGIQEAAKTARYLKENDMAQGVYIVAPLRKASKLMPLMERIADL